MGVYNTLRKYLMGVCNKLITRKSQHMVLT